MTLSVTGLSFAGGCLFMNANPWICGIGFFMFLGAELIAELN